MRLLLYSFIFHTKISFFIIVGNDVLPGLNSLAISILIPFIIKMICFHVAVLGQN